MSNPPPVEFRPGMEVVPGYTLISPLGSGMAGDVWQAQAAGGIKVALKVVRNLKDLGGRKELKALKTIRDVHHPNLCPLFGFWTKDAAGRVLADGETEDLTFDSVSHPGIDGPPGMPAQPRGQDDGGRPSNLGGTMAVGSDMYPVMNPAATDAVVSGQPAPSKPRVTAEQLIVVMGLGDCTLFDRLKYVRQEAGLAANDYHTPYGLDAVETIRYLRASASAIDLLNQEHQIYHCDIKPQNILLVGGEAQVCDFGLAKQMEGDMFKTQQAFATPAYAPPEVLHNEGYSRQVDQYSLAVTYYELRTGLLPFDITTHASMLVAKSTGKLNLEALSPAERKVLQKALRRVPNERYDSCTEFVNAIAVASGVEKSGGITVGKIVAAVSILFIAVGLALGAWRWIAPDSFAQVFHNSNEEIAGILQSDRQELVAMESAEFDRTHLSSLTKMISRSAGIAKDSSGQLKTDAEGLFSDAIFQLVGQAHRAMRGLEQAGTSSSDVESIKSLTDSLAMIDSESGNIEPAIALGIKNWAAGDEKKSASFKNYQSLYDAAIVRFAVLRNVTPPLRSLQSLRDILDTPQLDFGSADTIDRSLAALLPVLATTPEEQIDEMSPDQWLQDQRVMDLVRAEKSLRTSGTSSAYSRRWDETREKFTLAVSGVITGSTSTSISIDQRLRDQVLEGFPDLQIQTRIGELRRSVEQLRWSEVATLIRELNATPSLTNDQSALVSAVSAITEGRDHVRPLEQTLQLIRQSGIDSNRLSHLRTQNLFASYLREIGQRVIDGTSPAGAELYLQMGAALELEQQLEQAVPNEYLAATAISLLRHHQAIIDPSSTEHPLPVQQWLERLDTSEKSIGLAAAIRMEMLISGNETVVSSAESILQALNASDRQYLDLISPRFSDYLIACGASFIRQDVTVPASVLATASRQSIESLGHQRLILGTNLLVRRAVEVSGIDDDELVLTRYSKQESSQASVDRALSYLKLASFLASHTDDGTTDSLAEQVLISGVATGANLGSLSIPAKIDSDLRQWPSAKTLSNQVLLAVHRIGVNRLRDGQDDSNQDQAALQWLLRPATVLLERFGADQFGPLTGPSPSKDKLLSEVLIPTAQIAVLGNKDSAGGHLLPAEWVSADRLSNSDLLRFCKIASVAYTDPRVASLFADQRVAPDHYHRHAVVLGALASQSDDISDAERQSLQIRSAWAAVSIAAVTSGQLEALASQFAQMNAKHSAEGLISEAYERIAREKELAADSAAAKLYLSKALQSAKNSLESLIPNPGPLTMLEIQRYELLTRCNDLGVRYAFLNEIPDKLPILQQAAQHGEDAVRLYDSRWRELVRCPIASAYIAKGNAYEDIAHYCSQDTVDKDPAVVRRRETSFDLAIDAFGEAKRRNETDLKTRFSLARCQYRYAITCDEQKKTTLLEEALKSLGPTPAERPGDVQDTYALSLIPEWFHWKLTIELAHNDISDAIRLAGTAFSYVEDDRVPIDTRNVLAYACADAYVKGSDWKKAVDSLMYLGERGTAARVIQRMSLASDIDFANLLPGGASSANVSVFSEHLRILDLIPVQRIYTDQDEEAYELAKTATRCVREQVARLNDPNDRRTGTIKADLSLGVRTFARRLDPQSRGGYFALAETLFKGDDAAMNANPTKLFEFACELAQRIDSIPDPPNHANDRTYIKRLCGLIAYYSIGYWRTEVAKADENQRQNMVANAHRFLTAERLAALTACITTVARTASDEGRTNDEKFALGAVKMLQEVAEKTP